MRRPGAGLGTRCEIKNLNSLRSLGRAIDHEARRQIELIEAGDRVTQQTRHWDEEGGCTRPGRSKEEAEDYRYFQEPDLVPLAPSAEWVKDIDEALPTLPAKRRSALGAAAGMADTHAGVVIAVDRDLDALGLAAIQAGGDPARVLTHIEHNLAVEGADALEPEKLADLVKLELEGKLTATQAKVVLAEMVATGTAPAEIAAARGFEAMATSALEATVDEVIGSEQAEWDELVRAPEDDKRIKKLNGFFTGKIMKASRGQADGKAVNALLVQRRSAARVERGLD